MFEFKFLYNKRAKNRTALVPDSERKEDFAQSGVEAEPSELEVAKTEALTGEAENATGFCEAIIRLSIRDRFYSLYTFAPVYIML